MSSLPTPPIEDTKSRRIVRRSSKPTKQLSRTSERASVRVRNACERCRMKKIKCDGVSPCQRCKTDELVCTAGNRKRTGFKQSPQGYAEVLENTHYALVATVQKLYTMVRNNESWELRDPDKNKNGQPVIHDIAYMLGCIRPSPGLPSSFPEGEEDFAELKLSIDRSLYSPALDRTERASSGESDHSNLSKEYNQIRNRNAISHTPKSHL